MKLLRNCLGILLVMTFMTAGATDRKKLNFNGNWRLAVGDMTEASLPNYDDSRWQQVTLPYAFNGDEAFRKDIVDLTDTIVWYRKTFLMADIQNKKVFIEFEGVRQGADFWLNGKHLGFSENGVMACGFDLTPYIIEGENILAVRCDNSWTYHSREYNSRYQWNDRNFNANYGGIPKNVYLHITDKLYQTLPLYYTVHRDLIKFQDMSSPTSTYYLATFHRTADSLVLEKVFDSPIDTIVPFHQLNAVGIDSTGRFYMSELTNNKMTLKNHLYTRDCDP